MQTLKQKWPTYKIRLHIPNVANISKTGISRASHSPPFPFPFKTLADSIRREHKSSLTKRRNINRNFKFFFQFLSEDWHDRARWILRGATLVVNERRFVPVEEREDGTIGPLSVRIIEYNTTRWLETSQTHSLQYNLWSCSHSEYIFTFQWINFASGINFNATVFFKCNMYLKRMCKQR